MIFIDPGLIIFFASLKGTPMSNNLLKSEEEYLRTSIADLSGCACEKGQVGQGYMGTIPGTSGRAIKVVLAQQYGQEVIRPVCPDAELFCEIAGTKTLTRRMIHQIKSLGYRVEVVPTEPKEL